ncbi:MAG: hypothetical protein ICV60_04805 [Pyrinomonadaceae bacterium]|nr:hypothetical protein [Pyrinomonadaceae bacterium]
MKFHRSGQITSRDNHKPWYIRQGGHQPRMFCAECTERIQMITLEEAVVAANVEANTIYSLIEAAKLHYATTTEGILLLCLNSLINFRESEKA